MQEQNNIDIEKMVADGGKNIEQIQKEQTVQDLFIAKLKEQKEKAINFINAQANNPILEMLETIYEAHLKIAQLELRVEELEKGVKK